MSRHPRRKAGAITTPLNDSRNKRRTVELVHLSRHTNILIDQRLIVRNHVFIRSFWICGFFKRVCSFGEEMPPHDSSYKLQKGYDVEGTELRAGWFAVEEEVEEFETYWVALDI